MVHRLIAWAVYDKFVVCLLALALVGVGAYAAYKINVEAYPDPAPAIVEVIAQFPGASAEEVERQVTVPLEVALAGMPGLQYTRTKSLFGLAHMRNQFDYDVDYRTARSEVIQRLKGLDLPKGVEPQIAPTSPTGEIYRFLMASPKTSTGQYTYPLTDLKALQDFTLEKEFRRIPRIADIVGFGGAVRRYEIQPDPDRMRHYSITLDMMEKAISDSNANAGGDFLRSGRTVQVVRGMGLLGSGGDPTGLLIGVKDPVDARRILANEELRRCQEIRQIVLSATNNIPVKVDDVVTGGPLRPEREEISELALPKPNAAYVSPGGTGVYVGNQTRLGKVSASLPILDENGEPKRDEKGRTQWKEMEEAVEGVVLLRKGEQSLPALVDVRAKVKELNDNPGKLLPGVKLETFYDRGSLIGVTTETVKENLIVGLVLVTVILLVFLNHIPSTIIVAINIPLALLFAMAVLHFRGKSANLLSLGAVDFGIIVDFSVIMVESIYRMLSSNEESDRPLDERIVRAASEVERSLFFSAIIMVFALLPLFTMSGPEGQIFGPMADTYAFALGGAMILAMTLSPVLCGLFFRRVKATRPNALVRFLQWAYGLQLDMLIRQRWLAVVGFLALIGSAVVVAPRVGMEFMPQLEEGNVYIRATFPVSVSLDDVSEHARTARKTLEKYAEVEKICVQMGRPDDGTDPTGFYNVELNVPLRPRTEWPALVESKTWWEKLMQGKMRPRTKDELVAAMDAELSAMIPGIDWGFSQMIRDNVMELLSGVKGENSVKIFGPDLDQLEKIATDFQSELTKIRGIDNVGIFRIKGQANLEFTVDREKCAMWNINVGDVLDVLQTAVGGKSFTSMVEGERKFDVTLRYAKPLRDSLDRILELPVDVPNSKSAGAAAGQGPNVLTGTSKPIPAVAGQGGVDVPGGTSAVPRRRLRDLVTPRDASGRPDPNGKFLKSGASTISREQGNRFIAVKFGVKGRDLAGAVAEAQEKTKKLAPAPYRTEWSGEFQEMNEAIHRLSIAVGLSLCLIAVLVYLALGSFRDTVVVFCNVVVMGIGGIWALYLTGSTFNISAGVGFVSILGVGIMNGLMLISRFNANRLHGMDVFEAVRDGVRRQIRPLTMVTLTAIFGLLPAAFSTRIGSQSQQPLAIVVVGGMLVVLATTNLVPILYTFYGHRTPKQMEGMAH